MTEQDPQKQLDNLANALRNLVKLIKAVQYYPPGHPTLKAAVEEALQGFAPMLAGGANLTCTVRKEGFFLNEKPVGSQNPVLTKLAPYLFARRIQSLMVLPDLNSHDLRSFARCLTIEPSEIHKLGGIQEVLLKARVSTIWVNEMDLTKILARKEEIEAEKRAHPGEDVEVDDDQTAGSEREGMSAEERNLARIIQDLRQETLDQRYRVLLQELIPLIHLNLTEEARPLVLEALTLLGSSAGDPRQSNTRREYSLHALNQLATEDILDYLVEILCSPTGEEDLREHEDDLRELVLEILISLQGKLVIWRLMSHLAEESDGRVRKILTEAIIRQGQAAVPVLLEYLEDERWFVVRNAVAILGEIRDQEATGQLRDLLRHRDVRVRRETIRSLTKIGGQSAVGILLRTVEEADPELRRQALLSLGAMKSPAAVPTLLRLVGESDPMLKNVELKKDAIKALGDIGSTEATALLLTILGHRRFWRRSIHDELRAAAAQALGEIGDPRALAALTKASQNRSNDVARAATQALKQLKRGEEHGPGTP